MKRKATAPTWFKVKKKTRKPTNKTSVLFYKKKHDRTWNDEQNNTEWKVVSAEFEKTENTARKRWKRCLKE